MKYKLFLFVFLVLSVKAYSQSCTLTVSVTASNTTICSGDQVVLTATPSSGTPAYSYAWSTGETTQSISVNKAGTYTVTVKDQTAGCQPVSQNITIISGTTPIAPTSAGALVCINTSATLTATAPGGVYQWYDAATGGNFLGAGASYTTPPIVVKTVFYVQTTLNSCTSARTAVTVFPILGPDVINGSTCVGSSVTLIAANSANYQWYDAPGGNLLATGPTFTTPPLFTTTNYYVTGTINGCTSPPTTATATILPPPAAPTASGITICAGSSTTLHASGVAGATFDWFTTPAGGSSLISSPDYTTAVLNTTTVYYVQATVNGCISARTAVTVNVNPTPAAPTAGNVIGCSGNTATLTATAPGGTYQWYSSATSTTVLASGPTFITPVLNTSTTYYVEATNGGCTGQRTAVSVTINPTPTAPIANGQTICSGSSAVLTALGPGGNYQWYDAPTGGNLLVAATSYTTTALIATTTYYVQTTINGCTSSRTPVTVTVNTTPAAPTANSATICTGSAATLSASGAGTSYEWYDAAAGGNLLASTQTYTTPALTANTTYYVQTIANGCNSLRTAVAITVTTVPSPPTAANTTVCAGTSATLTATAASGTVQWYDAATAGNLLFIGNTYTTPALAATTTYYIQAINGSCASSRNAVTVTVTSLTNQFQYSSGTYCKSGTNPAPVINVAGGTFSASPAGLVFVSNSTGVINLAASTIGSYTITYSNACAISTEQLAIVISPDPLFTYGAPAYCQGGTTAMPVYTNPVTGTGGIFTATPAGLVFTDKYIGVIDLTASTPGTYTVTNTIAASGGCATTAASTTITIDPKVVVSAGPNQTVATGTPVQLAGSVSGGVSTGTWSGGTGTYSPSKTALNAIYTPGPGETNVTLTLTSANPGTSCGAQSSTVTITFSPMPAAPTASGTSICSGSTVTLTATAPGGTYQWYDAATSGTLLNTGPTYTTPALLTTTTYYVQTTIGGVASNRTAVTVTVNAIPVAPVAAGATICSGSAAILTAGGSTGIYQWYDAPAGGNLLFTGANYTTPFLTANVSYFVQAIFNGCIGPRTEVDLTVNPVPTITSASTAGICSGNALNYSITADMPTATFTWSRAAVAGISNAAVANQTSNTIAEMLINTSNASINVVYVITPLLNGCAGTAFNYVVTVYPVTVVTSANTAVVCTGNSVNYTITFNTAGTNASWSRAAVAGISNSAVSGQISNTVQEILNNATAAPVNVNYVFTYNTGNCSPSTFNVVVTVNPTVNITSAGTGTACGNTPQAYTITSNIPTAVYSWDRPAVAGISNPASLNNVSNQINESLVNTTTGPVIVNYYINTISNGCQPSVFVYSITVYPQPPTPVANANSPVCVGSTINLLTPTIFTGASYLWSGPNGFTSTLQNPVITNATAANTGTYTLYLITNGCSSVGASVDVTVDAMPVSNAGPDQIVCPTISSVTLGGTETGGTPTGIWTTNGTGTFSPSANQLNAQYIPSGQDKINGSVILTLSSTSKDDCFISTDNMTITFQITPAADAGPDQSVCSQENVVLNGKILIGGNGTWTTSGSGTFSPSSTQINGAASPVYVPGAVELADGKVTLTLTANAATSCNIPSDQVVINLIPPPTVYAGGTRYVLKGNTIVLNPTVSNDTVTYLWTPNIFINNNKIKNPTITGDVNTLYTLQVTDSRGCVSTDQAQVIVSPPLIIPNTFTPNGDGVNDLWDIQGIVAYPDANVDIYTRSGKKVFHSIGYGTPWDGTYAGQQLPFGTYYYVIDTKSSFPLYSGFVLIIR